MPVNIEELLRKIRREIEAARPVPAAPLAAPAEDEALPPIMSRPELAYINRNWRIEAGTRVTSHRRLLGPLIVRFKDYLQRLVLLFLEGYLRKTEQYRFQMMQMNNALAERSDRLLREVTERTKAVAERNDVFLAALDLRLEALEARDQMRTALASAATPSAPTADEALAAEMAVDLLPPPPLAPFLALFGGRVLVLGAGRGELLRALREAAGSAEGVEASAALAADCRTRGLEVRVAPLLPYLESLDEEALDGLLVTHVAGRFEVAAWSRLVAAAWRALRPGGVALFHGASGSLAAERLRWLVARQRFSVVETAEDVVLARRSAGR